MAPCAGVSGIFIVDGLELDSWTGNRKFLYNGFHGDIPSVSTGTGTNAR